MSILYVVRPYVEGIGWSRLAYDLSDSRVYSDVEKVLGMEWAQAIGPIQVEGRRVHVVCDVYMCPGFYHHPHWKTSHPRLDEIGQKVGTMEFCGGNPGVFIIRVPFPWNEILTCATKVSHQKYAFEFVFSVNVGKLYGAVREAYVRKNNRLTGPKKPRLKGAVNTRQYEGLRAVQTIRDIVDTLRDGKRIAELGHKFSGAGDGVGGQMTGGKEDQVANLTGARASISIGLYDCGLV
jgi:hypothetical protein